MVVTVDTVLVQEQGVATAVVDDRVSVLSLQAERYFQFNDTGSAIWNLLGEPKRVGEICRLLAQSYQTDSDQISHEVTAFLQRLFERRLVRVAG